MDAMELDVTEDMGVGSPVGSPHPEKVTFRMMHRQEMHPLTVDARYSVDKIVGAGAYGVVALGHDEATNTSVAIKKLRRMFDHPLTAKRSLRELKIQTYLDHPNILKLHDIMTIDPDNADDFSDIYVVVDPMPSDLHKVLSKQKLSPAHCRFFMYQILKALKYMHSANCMHRDLKPANVLCDGHCNIKVCDFGLAKQEQDITYMATVVTRYYRAPELFLDPLNYDEKIDIWAAGCILGELMKGSVFLRGASDADQRSLLLHTFGRPPQHLVDGYHLDSTRRLVDNFRYPAQLKTMQDFFPKCKDPELLDLLTQMLNIDWHARPSAAELLEHPAFAEYRVPESETVCEMELPTFDFEIDPDLPIDVTRQLIHNEMLRFHPELGVHDPELYTHHFAEGQAGMVVDIVGDDAAIEYTPYDADADQ